MNSNGDSNKKNGSQESKVSEKNMTKATMISGTEHETSKNFNSGEKKNHGKGLQRTLSVDVYSSIQTIE